jgi:hypothetical protein
VVVDRRLSEARFERDIRSLLDHPDDFAAFGIHLVNFTYPVLLLDLDWKTQGRRLRLHVDSSDYDYFPPAGWWVDDKGDDLVTGRGLVPSGAGFQSGSNPYKEGRSWFCWEGWREFHNYPGHHQVNWAAIRKQPDKKPLALIRHLHHVLNSVAGVTAA